MPEELDNAITILKTAPHSTKSRKKDDATGRADLLGSLPDSRREKVEE